MHVLKGNEFPVVTGHVIRPECVNRSQILIGNSCPARKRNPECLELLPGPAQPGSQNETSMAELIDIGADAGHLQGMTVGEGQLPSFLTRRGL